MTKFDISAINLDAMQQRTEELRPTIVRTPVAPLTSTLISQVLDGSTIHLKMECFQHTGTFKARGALSVARAIPTAKKMHGITAASAGNHAIASAWAAQKCGLSAKVVMQSSANPFRVKLAQAQCAEIIMKDGGPATFAEAERLQTEEGRTFIHPFEGLNTSLGTAGVGLEFLEDVPDLEAVIVAVGGGGLISGIAAAVKAINPACKVYGVEPAGADSMSRSLAAQRPVVLDKVDTIADSLAPPMALPLGHALCAAYVDDIVTVTDDEICAGMVILQQEAKLAVEPAVGAVMAGLMLPLRNRLKGKRIGLVVCGANIDVASYTQFLERGQESIYRLTDYS